VGATKTVSAETESTHQRVLFALAPSCRLCYHQSWANFITTRGIHGQRCSRFRESRYSAIHPEKPPVADSKGRRYSAIHPETCPPQEGRQCRFEGQLTLPSLCKSIASET